MAMDFLSYVVSCVPARLVCVMLLHVKLLALSMEETVCSCGPVHVFDNTPLVLLLESSHFCNVVADDRVKSFSFAWFSEEWACVVLLFVVLCYDSVLPQNIYLLS
jgi:hypothetical protein